ncbi:MAG: hypothetical protein GEV09_18245, partial [Pseudonocardiaceae bacterium]|nr:hypothetical protein [Pseudonocardiaceae bacterium]
MTTQERHPCSRAGAVVVGLIADPSAAPEQVARHLSGDLPELLAERLKDDRSWRVEVITERLPAIDASHSAMVELARRRAKQHDWNVAVCVTGLPLRSGKQPIVADVARAASVAVVSLPAFGAMALRRRIRGVVAQVIVEMQDEGQDPAEQQRQRPLPELSNRFRRVTPETEGVDVRVLASRGGARLLVGMVRTATTNRNDDPRSASRSPTPRTA